MRNRYFLWLLLASSFLLLFSLPAYGQDTDLPPLETLTESQLRDLALTLSRDLATTLETRPPELKALRDKLSISEEKLLALGADLTSKSSELLETRKKLDSSIESSRTSLAVKDVQIRNRDDKIKSQALLLKIEGIGIAVAVGAAATAIIVAALK